MQNADYLKRIALGLSMALLVLSQFGAITLAAPARRDCSSANAVVLSPPSGSTVTGVVQIEGTASLGGDFHHYELAVAPGNSEGWGGIGDGREQVVNGQLGVWDSASLPDGVYRIRLRVVDVTSNYCEAFASDLHVQNATPPTPTTPPESPTPEETEAPPIENAVPTPLPTVVVPGAAETAGPTATPARPGTTRTPSAGGSLVTGVDASSIVDAVLDFFSTIMRTFLFGILLMAGILVLVGVIFFVRRVL